MAHGVARVGGAKIRFTIRNMGRPIRTVTAQTSGAGSIPLIPNRPELRSMVVPNNEAIVKLAEAIQHLADAIAALESRVARLEELTLGEMQ